MVMAHLRPLRSLVIQVRPFSSRTPLHNAASHQALRAPHGAFDPDNYAESVSLGETYAKENGWDMNSLVEQPIIWGDIDSFQHVNNVLYIRYFETGRLRFMRSLLKELPSGSDESLIKGKPGGLGVILGSISAKYRRPVTYPDTLLVGHRVKRVDKDRFALEQMCWSFQQKAVTTVGESEMVCYDYGALKKMNMTPEFEAALRKRMA